MRGWRRSSRGRRLRLRRPLRRAPPPPACLPGLRRLLPACGSAASACLRLRRRHRMPSPGLLRFTSPGRAFGVGGWGWRAGVGASGDSMSPGFGATRRDTPGVRATKGGRGVLRGHQLRAARQARASHPALSHIRAGLGVGHRHDSGACRGRAFRSGHGARKCQVLPAGCLVRKRCPTLGAERPGRSPLRPTARLRRGLAGTGRSRP